MISLQPILNMQGNQTTFYIKHLLDYNVVNIILISKINIMEVELQWNDNKQESLISESVAAIRTILQLVREQPNNMTHGRSRRPYMWTQFTTSIKESS
jgi:hypothetical protein